MLRKAFVAVLAILVVSTPFFSLSTQSISTSTDQIFWGAWVGSHHIGYYNLLSDFEAQVGKGVSIWNWIQLWNRPQDSENIPNFDFSLMNQARSHGVIPMVSWGPESGNPAFPFYNLDSIINGSQDAYLIKWGQDSAKWGHPYFVRLMWEFTGSWTYDQTSQTGVYPWGAGNSPAKFIQAWQHVVNVVRGAGGTQISWVWCPAMTGDSEARLSSCYPGDNYVDWLAVECYIASTQSFSQYVQPMIDSELNISPNKPQMIAEIGYGDTNPGTWWTNILNNVMPRNPNIKAVVIWEMPPGLTVVNSATLSSFKQAISSSYYASNIYANLNVSPLEALNGTPNSTPTPSSQLTPSPTYIYSTSLPNSTSTHNVAVPSKLSWSDITLVGVIIAIIVCAFSLILRKRFIKNTK